VLAAVGDPFTPQGFLTTPRDTLRAAGLSGAKTAALLDLSAHVADGRLDLMHLGRLRDDAVVDALTVVRGIGPWTAHMFTMFALHRLDVWPVGDLGVRAGFALAFGLPIPHAAALEPLGEPYRPYRSVVAWYCWHSLDASRLPPPLV
jgi:DNA-3-methyladenine glycosylase II